MKKLAIVVTHPVQYNAPWFKLLAERGRLKVRVFYTWSQLQQGPKYDPDFGKIIEWDLPLLEGYEHEFVTNVSKNPGSHHFKGIDTPGLNAAIANWQPDAVLIIGWAYKGHLNCMRYFKNKIPVLFRGDSTLLDETRGLKKIIRRLFLTWVYRYIDTALYAGTNNKKYFEAHRVCGKHLVPAFHAIDNDRFWENSQEWRQEAIALRSQLDIKPDDFVVLFAGKMEEKKNPGFLLKLAKQIKDPSIIFLLVGNGHLEEELKLASSEDSRFRFLPFQNQTKMPAIYSLGSIFILPSVGPGETWGLAANEAMACGLPVVLSSKAGGAIDLVKDNGMIFDPADITGVQTYIETLKKSPALYEDTRRASLRHIKNFSFAQVAQAVEIAAGA